MKKDLFNFLKTQRLLNLATLSKKPYICTVFYAEDSSGKLYFISEPLSKHCKNISSNTSVAVAISDSHQRVTDKKKGLQIEGSVHEVIEKKEIKHALNLWNAKNPGFEKVINYQNMKNGKIKGHVYRISPSRIKFFNEELYGPEGYKIFTEEVLC